MAFGLDSVMAALNSVTTDYQKRTVSAMDAVCAALAGWAKAEHTYTDRTSNNTKSIDAGVVEVSRELVRGVLTAGMEYSVFLELARDGKWAFLWPVLERHEAEIMQIIAQEMGGSSNFSMGKSATLDADYESYKTTVREGSP